jgi:drug/metabolite transporter (DMT)-like permease
MGEFFGWPRADLLTRSRLKLITLLGGRKASGLRDANGRLASGGHNPRVRDIAAEACGSHHPPTLLSILCAVSSAACWGIGTVAAKGALEEGIKPLSLVIVQLTASLALLSLAVLPRMRQIKLPTFANTEGAALSGVLEYGVTYALAAFGLALTTAGNAALIGAAEPALIVLAATLLLREQIKSGSVILLAAVTAGLVCVMWPDVVSVGLPGAGDLLVLGSAATGAVYAVLSRRFVRDIAPLPLSVLQQAAGLLAVLVGSLTAMLAGWSHAGTAGFGKHVAGLELAVLSGLLQHAAAVWLHLHALKGMPAGAFAMFLALVPVFAVATANLALGEAIAPSQLAGGLLIVTAAAGARHMYR